MTAERIRITGWGPGFKKISCTKALQEYCGRSLSEAKGDTDRILEGDSTELQISKGTAEQLVGHLTGIGVVCEVIDDDQV